MTVCIGALENIVTIQVRRKFSKMDNSYTFTEWIHMIAVLKTCPEKGKRFFVFLKR